MAYKFKAQLKKNPINKEVRYYAVKLGGESASTLQRAIRAVEKTSTVSSADVKAVLDALQNYIIEELREGRSVQLSDLGTFSTTLSSEGCDSSEEVTARAIRRVRVQFRPSTTILDALRRESMSFERVAVDAGAEAETQA